MNFMNITKKNKKITKNICNIQAVDAYRLMKKKKALRLHSWFDITFIEFLIHIRKEITFPTLIIPNNQ